VTFCLAFEWVYCIIFDGMRILRGDGYDDFGY